MTPDDREVLPEPPLMLIACWRCASEGVTGEYDREYTCSECGGEGWFVEEAEPNDGDEDDDLEVIDRGADYDNG